ncbi:hypothetical protein PGB90_005611 [Kerria lacca]
MNVNITVQRLVPPGFIVAYAGVASFQKGNCCILDHATGREMTQMMALFAFLDQYGVFDWTSCLVEF